MQKAGKSASRAADPAGDQLGRALAEKDRLLRELRESEQNYREIFNATTEAIAVEDTLTGRFVEVNDPMVRMYGYASREELMACSIGDLSECTPPYTQGEAQRRNDLAVAGSPQVFEWIARKKSGELFYVEVSLTCSPIRGEHRVLAVVRDITERKLAQEALRRSNAQLEAKVTERTLQLREMTARLIGAEEAERERIGHVLHEDLQQILVGLQLMLRASRAGAPGAESPSSPLSVLSEAIQVTRSLGRDLLPPVLHEGHLRPALAWLVDDMRQRFNLEVQLDMAADAEPASQDVRVFIFRAVHELCLNIVKHAQTLCASLRIAASDAEWLKVEIRDRGLGFNVLEPRHGGVGLYRIRERAASFGGELQISSAMGAGSRFTLILPRR